MPAEPGRARPGAVSAAAAALAVLVVLAAVPGPAVAAGASRGVDPRPPGPAGSGPLASPGPADSLVPALRARAAGGENAGEAEYLLGQLHYARGEYLQARQAFSRAQQSLAEPGRSEARYQEALTWMALREPARARVAAEPLAEPPGPLRGRALALIGLTYEAQGDLVRALSHYERSFEAPGEDDPGALARAAALYLRLGRPERSRQTYDLLLALHPRSIEAATARAAGVADGEPRGEALSVRIGAFADAARARALLARARSAGFANAEVVAQGAGTAQTFAVSLGTFETRDRALEAGLRAEQMLGTRFWLALAR